MCKSQRDQTLKLDVVKSSTCSARMLPAANKEQDIRVEERRGGDLISRTVSFLRERRLGWETCRTKDQAAQDIAVMKFFWACPEVPQYSAVSQRSLIRFQKLVFFT
ncbi:hypothetical protein Y1Q_0005611 [Alligator mississippiensis]|uniref:Uncharacterized protein n=1 Tax=Alligator mississippiensis TaxID=8496 RepID=A0A151MF80_ALLMI|nr:hypothetical protein Y1Q_0005611 [Alligator mississippiensis]